MKVRFYCDLPYPYHIPSKLPPSMHATTHPYSGKITEGFKRYCFDVDFPPDAVLQGQVVPCSGVTTTPGLELAPIGKRGKRRSAPAYMVEIDGIPIGNPMMEDQAHLIADFIDRYRSQILKRLKE